MIKKKDLEMDTITLIKIDGSDYSIGVGTNCFPIINSEVVHETSQKLGAEFSGNIEKYNKRFEEAKLAYKEKIFDSIQNNGLENK